MPGYLQDSLAWLWKTLSIWRRKSRENRGGNCSQHKLQGVRSGKRGLCKSKLLSVYLKIQEWTDAVGTDGNLVNNTLSYIKSGNGIDSVDEIVKTESVKQKLVYATVTYTNKSDEEINHMLYIGTLLLMDHEDGSYQIYDPTEQSGDDYDRVIWDGVARTAEMTYNSISEDYGNGGNYISSLKPGESIQVNMAWIVNENDLNNMYLSLNGDGATYEFSDSMLKTGLVDIYQ